MKIKNYLIVLVFAFAGTFIFSACQNNDKTVNQNVEGTYVGSFTTSSTLKSETTTIGNMMDTAIVQQMSDGQINVHCFGNDMDSTFILNTYQNGDSMMVCLDGHEFDNEYGHMMGSGSMMGNNSTEWRQHMNGEHQAGDNHYGGFNMQNGTFSYSFKMMDGTSINYRKFQGTKQ